MSGTLGATLHPEDNKGAHFLERGGKKGRRSVFVSGSAILKSLSLVLYIVQGCGHSICYHQT